MTLLFSSLAGDLHSRWTPLTCCFSHQDLSHILFNGFTFFFMAQPVLQMLGSRQFIFLYLGGLSPLTQLGFLTNSCINSGGLISSFSSIAYAKLAGKKDYASHGASGEWLWSYMSRKIGFTVLCCRCNLLDCFPVCLRRSNYDIPAIWDNPCARMATCYWSLFL